MRELEERTGVGRETIRFYIREGLLPEPARASRNSASYNDDHVTRLRAIKRLQEERFLPLAVIRTLLDSDADGSAERWLEPQAFPQLDQILAWRLDHDAPRVPLTAVMAQTGADDQDVAEQQGSGIIAVDGDGTVSARDAAIMRVLGDLKAVGFTSDRGFDNQALKIYLDFVEWITAQEMRLFFEHTAGQVDEAEAIDMAERGVGSINELLGLLRTRTILAKLAARRRIANDNN